MDRKSVCAAAIGLAVFSAPAAPVIRTEAKPWGTDYTLVSSDGDGDVVLVSVKPKCVKYASQMANMYSDDEYGVGVRAWDIRDEMIQADGELKVVVRGGRAGATASVIEGPRATLAGRFAAAGRAHGAPVNAHGGPLALSSDGARLSYMFAELTTASCEDYIDLARRGGMGIVHFHDWWSSLGHYPVNTNYFPGGFAEFKSSAAKVHAAGLKVGMHTLSGCIDFKDASLGTDAVRDLQSTAAYTLARPLVPDAKELFVNERPSPTHDRVMTYSGNGNVLRIGSELIQYDDFTTNAAPYRFSGLVRRWCGSPGGVAHAAGTRVDYLRQRYLSFYPEPGTHLADEVAESIGRVFNDCNVDQIYFDGSEGMGTRYNIDWMRHRMFRALGRDAMVEASCEGKHNWYFHSRLNAWDFPRWNLNGFTDNHVKRNASVRKADLLTPQMGWWAPMQSDDRAHGHLRAEVEYCAGKTAALDASFAVTGVEEFRGPPPWLRLDQLTVIGWYEGFRTARAFTPEALARLAVPKDEYQLRQADDGVWRLRRVYRNVHRVTGLGSGTERWSVSGKGPMPAAIRAEILYGADEGGDAVVLLPAGRMPRKTWAYPYCDAGKRPAFAFDVNGDGSGRTLVLTVKTPREFSSAVSEHRIRIDFTGWHHVVFIARERDAADDVQLGARYGVYRNELKLDRLSEVSFSWADGRDGAIETGEVRACPVRTITANRPKIVVDGKTIEIPFSLSSGESAELEDGYWVRYAEKGEPLERVKGPEAVVLSGRSAVEWKDAARAEVTLTALGEACSALKADAVLPEYTFLEPRRFAPAAGFDSLGTIPVAAGERRQVRLDLFGAADFPVVTIGGERHPLPVSLGKGCRFTCRDGVNWILRDAKMNVVGRGRLEKPLPVLDATARLSISCASDAADIRVCVSTVRR